MMEKEIAYAYEANRHKHINTNSNGEITIPALAEYYDISPARVDKIIRQWDY